MMQTGIASKKMISIYWIVLIILFAQVIQTQSKDNGKKGGKVGNTDGNDKNQNSPANATTKTSQESVTQPKPETTPKTEEPKKTEPPTTPEPETTTIATTETEVEIETEATTEAIETTTVTEKVTEKETVATKKVTKKPTTLPPPPPPPPPSPPPPAITTTEVVTTSEVTQESTSLEINNEISENVTEKASNSPQAAAAAAQLQALNKQMTIMQRILAAKTNIWSVTGFAIWLLSITNFVLALVNFTLIFGKYHCQLAQIAGKIKIALAHTVSRDLHPQIKMAMMCGITNIQDLEPMFAVIGEPNPFDSSNGLLPDQKNIRLRNTGKKSAEPKNAPKTASILAKSPSPSTTKTEESKIE